MSGINTATQFVGTLSGGMKFETGYVHPDDITLVNNITSGDESETRGVPTTLNTVVAGWMYSTCDGGGEVGCLTGNGLAARSVCNNHASGGRVVDFTLDESTSSTDGDFYFIMGW
jgi:hypothetical protein